MNDAQLVWLIAGLGNPGRKYSRTRHNIGFMVIEEIAEKYKIDLVEKREYRMGRGSVEGHKVLLAEPLLYMNMSGTALKNIFRKSHVQPENLVFIHDDLDMETGRLRIRETGSSGGHKGVESIIQSIGSRDFIRVKIGIGRGAGIPAEEYVLKKFKKDEMDLIQESIQKASDAIFSIISEGVHKAMNKFNCSDIR
jgi:peptidyl-tRNA hydrolase, PTH1 family